MTIGSTYRVFARLLLISRPLLWVNALGPVVIGLWLTGDLWQREVVAFLLWVTLPFNLLIYGTNDIFDQETDAKNTRKGGLEGARILATETRAIVAGIILTNLPFLVYFVVAAPLTILPWICSLYAYLCLLLGAANTFQGACRAGLTQ